MIIPNIYPEDYHADKLGAPEPTLSSTLARKLILESPRHAWWASPRLNPDWEPVNKAAFDLGHAAHTALLSRGQKIAVIHADDWRKKDAREAREAAYAAGETPVLAAQWERIEVFTAAVRDHMTRLGLGEVFSDPERAEVAALAEIDGVHCRCMVDYHAADGWLYDLKTTMSAAPEAIRRTVESYSYHIQAAHYLETWRAAGGTAKGLRLVFVEKEPPHEVAVVSLVDDMSREDDWGQMAREQTAQARRLWRACLDADRWPGYPLGITTIGAPAWVAGKWEDRRELIPHMTPKAPVKPTKAALRAAYDAQAPL